MHETPDVESSTDDYATRFAGRTGEYLLRVQNRAMMRLARPWLGGTVLDVGGGHAQLCGPFLDAGCRVTVLGSTPACFDLPRRHFGDRVACVEGDLLAPPFPDRSFDVVVAIRMMAHVDDVSRFVRGLCRVARHAVIIDYPEARSVNAATPMLYRWKKGLEGNTRPYRLYRTPDVVRWFDAEGFAAPSVIGQFFWPMVVHRKLNSPRASAALEALPRWLGLTRFFGSPICLRTARR